MAAGGPWLVPVAAADGGVLKEQGTFEGLGLGPFDSLAPGELAQDRLHSTRPKQTRSGRAPEQ